MCDTKCSFEDIVDCVPVCVCESVCVYWLSWRMCKYIVAQNLTLHGSITCQGYRIVSNIVCFYLMAHCILGVVVCLKGCRCPCSGPAPVGLLLLTVLSLIYLRGRLLPRQNWSSWTSELLTHPTHVHTQMHTYTHYSCLIFALPCNKIYIYIYCQLSHLHINQPGQNNLDLSTSLHAS